MERIIWDHMESVIAPEVNAYQLHDSEVNSNQVQVTALILLILYGVIYSHPAGAHIGSIWGDSEDGCGR